MKPQYMNQEDVADESVYDHGFNDAIYKVLEIINIMDEENEGRDGDPARPLLLIEHEDFRKRVLALKGGEQE